MHAGIDIAGKWGQPIIASGNGLVEFSGLQNGYGKTVILDHRGNKTLYGHMSRIVVRKNQWVRQGEIIGYMGKSGNATGVHLHFEYRNYYSKAKNPRYILPPRNLVH